MKKKVLLSIVTLSIALLSYAQSERINLTVIINDEIVQGLSIQIKGITEKGEHVVIAEEVYYYPGNLEITSNNYTRLTSREIENIYLTFRNREPVCKRGRIVDPYNDEEYEIECDKAWLTNEYSLLYIYNLKHKGYNKKYYPISDEKNYEYMFVGSGPYVRIPATKSSYRGEKCK